MMRLDENIPATARPYATVAPILHERTLTSLANRSPTPNHGAAE
jgi:hypothetical protein